LFSVILSDPHLVVVPAACAYRATADGGQLRDIPKPSLCLRMVEDALWQWFTLRQEGSWLL